MAEATPVITLRRVRKNVIGAEKFDSFDVWIDGKFYCSSRYSDFANLSEQIGAEFPQASLLKFPPKKMNMSFFSLNDTEVEERRTALEAYLQKAFEIPKFHDTDFVKSFFSNQREIFLRNFSKEVEERIYLMDETFITLKIRTNITTEELANVVCETLELAPKNHPDFALFEVPEDPSEPEVKLQPQVHPWLSCRHLEFTSPGVEGKELDKLDVSIKPFSKIYLKKWVFSIHRIVNLAKDPVALRLIFAQAQADLKNKMIFPTSDERAELRKLALEGNSKDYMRLIRNCRGFGVTYMSPCKANHPVEGAKVMLGVSVDGLELHHIITDKRTGEEDVENFSWDKIRRWKYSEVDRTFSFQYYFTPKKEKWIVCETSQFLFVNSVIQEYVEELKRRMRSAGHTFSEKQEEEREEPSDLPSAPKVSAPPVISTETPAQPPSSTPAASPFSNSKPAKGESSSGNLFGSKFAQMNLTGSGSGKKSEGTFQSTITDDDL